MSYVKIWVHAVWGTKWRYPFLVGGLRTKALNHIVANASEKGIEICQINCWVDHFHCLIRLGPEQSIAGVIKLIKGEFSCWVNKAGLSKKRFRWAREYYAASVNERAVRNVKHYIQNQERHHMNQTYYQEIAKYFDAPIPERPEGGSSIS
ncbi:MAG: IS200/IS605 family transposase [Bacteroidetes bacterium]|nr:IS200/IS605 family transposase [Bacteroidota bacterium]